MIYCECNADKQLLRFFEINKRNIGHAGDKGRVVSSLERKASGIGIVDEDPYGGANPRSMKNYKMVDQNGDLKKLILDEKTLIVISPNLEGWYLNHAKKHTINPDDYQLPNDPSSLKDNPRYPQGNEFQRFQKDLFESCDEFKILNDWIS